MRKSLILLLLTFIGQFHLFAQANDQEAQLTYQLAQEEFDKANYQKVLKYLDKVESLNPDAKTKTSYLRAKCIEKQLDIDPANDHNYFVCLNNIGYYLANGKDEDKKAELIKIKIKIENSDEYLLAKDFENISKNDATQMIIKASNDYPPSGGLYSIQLFENRYLEIVKTLGVEKINEKKHDCTSVYISIVDLRDVFLNRGEKKITTKNTNSIKKYCESYFKKSQYANFQKDVASFQAGNNKTNGYNGFFVRIYPYNQSLKDSDPSLPFEIYINDYIFNSTKPDEKYNQKIYKAIEILMKQ